MAEDAPPGTRYELWVAWDPPVTEEPRIQLLLKEVILEQIIPPSVPEGPHAVMLLVKPKQVPRLLWGDRYGSLSAVQIRGS